jgi:hypothetical protein
VVDGGMAATGLMLAAGALVAGGIVVFVASGNGEWRDAYAVLAVALVAVWRLHRVGLYFSDRGLRVCHVVRSRTVSWAEVSRIESRPATVVGAPVRQHAIWVVIPGRAIESPVRQQRSRWMWDLARRELTPSTYRRTLHTLQVELARHRGRELHG